MRATLILLLVALLVGCSAAVAPDAGDSGLADVPAATDTPGPRDTVCSLGLSGTACSGVGATCSALDRMCTNGSWSSVTCSCATSGWSCSAYEPCGWRDAGGPVPVCGYPADPVFSRNCSTATECSFGDVQVVPCRHAVVGYRMDDTTNFNAYRDACYSMASNYPGRDGGVCGTTYETLLTDDGRQTWMGSTTNVTVECRAGVCTTVYR